MTEPTTDTTEEFPPTPPSPVGATITVVFAHGVILTAFVGSLLFVVPKFEEIFKSFGTELPARTQFILNVGNGVKAIGIFLPLIVAGFLVLDGLVYYHLRRQGADGWARAWWLFWLLLEGAAVVGLVIALFLPLVQLMSQVGASAGQ
ncbi:MAG TPA: hypothetical protein VMZ92_18445 [Planctomycetota bacterium]|nr:hypothetical protein [Planctomycetota bacterium]